MRVAMAAEKKHACRSVHDRSQWQGLYNVGPLMVVLTGLRAPWLLSPWGGEAIHKVTTLFTASDLAHSLFSHAQNSVFPY